MFGGYQDVAAYYMEEEGVGAEDVEEQLPLPLEYLPRFLGKSRGGRGGAGAPTTPRVPAQIPW